MKLKKLINKKGISLLELMTTVAIIGILAAIAIPTMQGYTIKAQVQESLVLASSAKTNIVEYFADAGELPNDNDEAGFEGSTGKYVSNVEVDSGAIVARFGNQANAALIGATVRITAVPQVNGTLKWVCSSTASEKYLPQSCRP